MATKPEVNSIIFLKQIIQVKGNCWLIHFPKEHDWNSNKTICEYCPLNRIDGNCLINEDKVIRAIEMLAEIKQTQRKLTWLKNL